jgi:hypothetical protein
VADQPKRSAALAASKGPKESEALAERVGPAAGFDASNDAGKWHLDPDSMPAPRTIHCGKLPSAGDVEERLHLEEGAGGEVRKEKR